MQNPVVILGAQELGVLALDAFQSNDVIVYCFLDDQVALQQKEINEITVMGNTEDENILKLLGKKCDVFVAAEDMAARKSLTNMLKNDYKVVPVNAIHKFSYVSEHAWLGHGNFIQAGAIVNANAKIGDNCLIGGRALVDANAVLEDHITLGPGAILNPGVTVAEGAFIGTGAVVVSGVKIGKNARVGAGAVVVADVPAKQTVFGNPAKAV